MGGYHRLDSCRDRLAARPAIGRRADHRDAYPSKPASIDVCLNAITPAVPHCLDLIGAGRIETDPNRGQGIQAVVNIRVTDSVLGGRMRARFGAKRNSG